MKLYKAILLGLILAAITVPFMRAYVINTYINTFLFGCETAATRVYKFNSQELGNELYNFCKIYENNIRREYRGEFD